MGHRQKGKRMKRKKSWHRGGVETKKYFRSTKQLGKVIDPDIDYTQASPEPVNSHTSKAKRHGK